MADNVLQVLVFRTFTAQEPGEQLLVLAEQQALEALAVSRLQFGVAMLHEGLQDQVQLQHAPTRRPAGPVEFLLTDHGGFDP